MFFIYNFKSKDLMRILEKYIFFIQESRKNYNVNLVLSTVEEKRKQTQK